MTRTAISNQRLASSPARLLATLSVAGALGLASLACAEERMDSLQFAKAAVARRTPAELERTFWRCDHAATTRWVGAGEGAECVAIYEELKRMKFGGDFPALLRWWEENKKAEHQAIAAANAAAKLR
jgi:hypothetical protein